jgi:predicted alpha/beta-fold hydrolase
MFTIFISYRRDCGGTFALLLEEKLTQAGFSAFLDHKRGCQDSKVIEKNILLSVNHSK